MRMMNKKDIKDLLQEDWKRIDYYKSGSLKLGIEHPLEWHVAYETPTNKALVIISESPLKKIDSSKSIYGKCSKRNDGKYYISFQLLKNSQEDVFIYMCSDLIEFSATGINTKEALKKVNERYRQWHRLMEKASRSILSESQRKGLIGELLFLKYEIKSGMDCEDALDGWVGPEGADQDFVYDGNWHEVKTTGLSSDQVIIHSVEQLGKSKDNGELIIYRVDACAPEAEGAVTLRKLVKDIYNLISESDDSLIEKFTVKLNKIGYIDLDEYDNYTYKSFGVDFYDVNDSFPRITRDKIRTEIIQASYSISIPAIDKWKRSQNG